MSDKKLVIVTELLANADDRGELSELLRADSPDYIGYGQHYCVRSYTAGTVRGLHRHHSLIDHFTIVRGAAKFRFFDDDGNCQEVVASERKLVRVTCPEKIWHGWVSLEDDTILISTASVPYMGYGRTGEKDEERIPHDAFDADKDGWAVLPR